MNRENWDKMVALVRSAEVLGAGNRGFMRAPLCPLGLLASRLKSPRTTHDGYDGDYSAVFEALGVSLEVVFTPNDAMVRSGFTPAQVADALAWIDGDYDRSKRVNRCVRLGRELRS